MTETLQTQAEMYLGSKIEPSEWAKAKAYAEHKRKLIIKREGDADGIRNEPWYLAELIAETVSSNRLSQFTLDLAAIPRAENEQMGLKKGQPSHKDMSRPIRYNPIVSQV